MRSTKGPPFSFREGLVSHCPSGHSLNPTLVTIIIIIRFVQRRKAVISEALNI